MPFPYSRVLYFPVNTTPELLLELQLRLIQSVLEISNNDRLNNLAQV